MLHAMLVLVFMAPVVLAMLHPEATLAATLPDAAAVALAVVVTATAAATIDTTRKRGRSQKNDARSRAIPRPFHEDFKPLRVRILPNGKLEKVPEDDTEGGAAEQATSVRGKGFATISAAHSYAYFHPTSASQFNAEQTAAMNATAAVRAQMTKAAQESTLGRNSGVSYWSKITSWAAFENWVLK